MNTIRNHSLLALSAACLLSALPAHAALVAYTPGDLLLGFRATGGAGAGTNYVVNLGQASGFRDGTTTGTLALGNIGADLQSIFGNGTPGDWASRNDLVWGIGGTPSNTGTVGGDDAPTLYASKAETGPGTFGTVAGISGSSTRLTIATTMVTAQDTFKGYQATTNSGRAVIQFDGDPNDWHEFMAPGGNASYTTGNKDFGGFSDLEGTVGQDLGLFRIISASNGTFLGSFSIDSAGNVSFTSAVPEPSALLLSGLAAGLVLSRRRRNA